jgi:hypothetical protein
MLASRRFDTTRAIEYHPPQQNLSRAPTKLRSKMISPFTINKQSKKQFPDHTVW